MIISDLRFSAYLKLLVSSTARIHRHHKARFLKPLLDSLRGSHSPSLLLSACSSVLAHLVYFPSASASTFFLLALLDGPLHSNYGAVCASARAYSVRKTSNLRSALLRKMIQKGKSREEPSTSERSTSEKNRRTKRARSEDK